jgi:hypothetical protein
MEADVTTNLTLFFFFFSLTQHWCAVRWRTPGWPLDMCLAVKVDA